jgi:hypothetical protein
MIAARTPTFEITRPSNAMQNTPFDYSSPII